MIRNVPAAVRPDAPAMQPLARQGEWTLHLPFQTQLSLNDRDHWNVKAKKVKTWREAAMVLAKAARIPACSRIRIELHYVPAQERRRDQDNLVACLKPLADGLVDAGVVPDDTERFVERVFPIIHPAQHTLPTRNDSRFLLRVICLEP